MVVVARLADSDTDDVLFTAFLSLFCTSFELVEKKCNTPWPLTHIKV